MPNDFLGRLFNKVSLIFRSADQKRVKKEAEDKREQEEEERRTQRERERQARQLMWVDKERSVFIIVCSSESKNAVLVSS